ncbi:uncharacterized protein BJ212DRAFT_1299670 [Suillus subaureus]|uniref:Uncharacterized protein n=1 Tax=Suillus subaureus TaxID=48587 RepID=A0A9P7EBE2_9AGAM|nr:uncharacterized protein BJ212DRAFT_1299670 [Suillus subaureus]KAG1816384.1 hypothetical protein BJ212DRAFT_1299670 [Suillus subaureus]
MESKGCILGTKKTYNTDGGTTVGMKQDSRCLTFTLEWLLLHISALSPDYASQYDLCNWLDTCILHGYLAGEVHASGHPEVHGLGTVCHDNMVAYTYWDHNDLCSHGKEHDCDIIPLLGGWAAAAGTEMRAGMTGSNKGLEGKGIWRGKGEELVLGSRVW